ncbi:partner of Y14 and mago-like [Ylistrum balloti]|uniref:partner of Y14 and mago-like n=1 Tax=Ylistrum balloti TaxID=509963 RepID=UPI0029058C16|nr:partner of Y14 and mago-like [Ylistrum balloti]
MATAGHIERDGIVRDEKTGEYYIPASQRPDGTWRKPRKVKDGYVPQEEMPTYENRGVQWMKSKSSLPPGLNPDEVTPKETATPQAADPYAGMSKAAKKNAKRKEKKKQQGHGENVDSVTRSLADTVLSNDQSQSSKQSSNQLETPLQDKADIEKKIRNLKKKLRQIEDLESKIKSGEIKEPAKEQLEKISKKATVLSDIEDLELDLVDV